MASYAARTWQETPGAVLVGLTLWLTTTVLLIAQLFDAGDAPYTDVMWFVLAAHAICSALVLIEAFEGGGTIWYLSFLVITSGSLATLFQVSLVREGLLHAMASAAQVTANSVMLALIFRKEALYGSFA